MTGKKLPPNQQIVASKQWPVVGESAPPVSDEPWSVSIDGCIRHSQSWTLDELRAMSTDTLTTDIHCVTRWSKFDMTFGGVFLSRLMEAAQPNSDARFLSFVARSERGHSTSLPLEVALTQQTLLALTVAGKPLDPCHGGPVRVVVPGRYFYKSVKWLERIAVLAEDALGYWESDAGYHNNADPWNEERFIASTLDKRQAQRLIASKDFTGMELLSLVAAHLDLRDLRAQGAQLRNADFRSSQLNGADFSHANLSNARFQSADLRDASFRDADLEGANLSGADLRGTDLTGASLFGASFVEVYSDHDDPAVSLGARFDPETRIDPGQLAALTEVQLQYVSRSL